MYDNESMLFTLLSLFACTGYQGSSIARMEEASCREDLGSQISVVDIELKKVISHISTCFNDNITYKVRFPARSISLPYMFRNPLSCLICVTGSAIQRKNALGSY